MIEGYFTRHATLFEGIRHFNDEQIKRYADTPQGVGWNSVDAQEVRFDQLLRVIEPAENLNEVSINDVGCGYGALRRYLHSKGVRPVYRGYDISEKMLGVAKSTSGPLAGESHDFMPLQDISRARYSVASGIFGLRLTEDEDNWKEYVLDTLDLLDKNSEIGFSFNMLTSFSDESKKKEELFYADPCYFFNRCMRMYSSQVALFHHYSLFDFTIVVRKH